MTAKQPVQDEKTLLARAYEGLAGVDKARLDLLSAMTLGSNGIDQYAYAVKSRIKSPESIVEKVLRKRKDKNYDVHDITDFIGVRILCLFSDDLEPCALWLLDFISRNPGGLFVGGGLPSAVREVVVYHASTSTAILYKACFSVISARYRTSIKTLKFEPAAEDQPYSSIHVVAQLRRTAESDIPLFVEFQLRTALEDVWAEMDHRLFYKSRRRLSNEIRLAKLMLASQKVHLDAISVTSDQIRLRCKQADKDPVTELYSRLLGVEVSAERAGVALGPQQVQDTFQRVQDAISNTYGDMEARVRSSKLPGFVEEDYSSIERLKHDIEGLQSIGLDRDGVDNALLTYFSKMETALCNVWLSLISSSLADSDPDEERRNVWRLRSDRHSDSANALYQELIDSGNYPDDAFVWFRSGYALLKLRKDHDAAAERFRESVARCAVDANIPADSQYRSVIPRMLGYCCWLKSADKAGDVLGAKALLTEAIQATDKLDEMETEKVLIRGNMSAEDERVKCLNNWIFYVADFRSQGGTWAELEVLGVPRDRYMDKLRLFNEAVIARHDTRAWLLHTLMHGWEAAEQHSLAADAARKVLIALDGGQTMDLIEENRVERIRCDALMRLRQTNTDGQGDRTGSKMETEHAKAPATSSQ